MTNRENKSEQRSENPPPPPPGQLKPRVLHENYTKELRSADNQNSSSR